MKGFICALTRGLPLLLTFLVDQVISLWLPALVLLPVLILQEVLGIPLSVLACLGKERWYHVECIFFCTKHKVSANVARSRWRQRNLQAIVPLGDFVYLTKALIERCVQRRIHLCRRHICSVGASYTLCVSCQIVNTPPVRSPHLVMKTFNTGCMFQYIYFFKFIVPGLPTL